MKDRLRPFFSIIIPVYNAGKLLMECLSSVSKQSFEDFEVIVVDDGSTDNSSAICDYFVKRDCRISVICQKNRGVSAARNLGLSLAKGKYVIFIDSDDFIETVFLETICKEIKGYDILFWGNQYHYANGTSITHQPKAVTADNRQSVEKEIMRLKSNPEGFEYFGFTWDKAFRLDIIVQNHLHFIEKLSFREDELFTADYCRYATTLKVIPSVLYHYRVLGTGLTVKHKSLEVLSLYVEAMKKQISYWQYKELKDYETSRYLRMLFRMFYCETSITGKWIMAKRINRLYHNAGTNNYLVRSRLFSLPSPFFFVIFPLCLIFGKFVK